MEAHTKRQIEKLKKQFLHNLEIIKIVSSVLDSNPAAMSADRSQSHLCSDNESHSNVSQQGTRHIAARIPSRDNLMPSDEQRSGETGELALTEIDKRLQELRQKKNILKDKLVTSLS